MKTSTVVAQLKCHEVSARLKGSIQGLLAAAVVSLAPAPAAAQISTGNLSVSATVANVCTVTATTLDFSILNLGVLSNEVTPGRIDVVCTANQGNVNVTISGGQYASGGSRRMSNGAGNFIPYSLYTTSSRTDAVALDGSIFTGTLTGAGLRSIPIYGQVPAGMHPAGTYNDVLLITMNY